MLICRNNCPAQRILARCVVALTLVVLTSCAARDYRPAPIAVGETLRSLEDRRATSSAVQKFFAENGRNAEAWPPAAWDFGTLALVAQCSATPLVVIR